MESSFAHVLAWNQFEIGKILEMDSTDMLACACAHGAKYAATFLTSTTLEKRGLVGDRNYPVNCKFRTSSIFVYMQKCFSGWFSPRVSTVMHSSIVDMFVIHA